MHAIDIRIFISTRKDTEGTKAEQLGSAYRRVQVANDDGASDFKPLREHGWA